MKYQGYTRAMVRGGAAGFFIFLALFLSVVIFPPLGEGVMGRILGEFPTPIPLLHGVSSALFGSSTNEGGILVVLSAVCLELVIGGAIVGYIFHRARTAILRRRVSGGNG